MMSSPEQQKRIIIERDVPIRMRDGTVTRADIYRFVPSFWCNTLLLTHPHASTRQHGIGMPDLRFVPRGIGMPHLRFAPIVSGATLCSWRIPMDQWGIGMPWGKRVPRPTYRTRFLVQHFIADASPCVHATARHRDAPPSFHTKY